MGWLNRLLGSGNDGQDDEDGSEARGGKPEGIHDAELIEDGKVTHRWLWRGGKLEEINLDDDE
jgi:hypothetical protein